MEMRKIDGKLSVRNFFRLKLIEDGNKLSLRQKELNVRELEIKAKAISLTTGTEFLPLRKHKYSNRFTNLFEPAVLDEASTDLGL